MAIRTTTMFSLRDGRVRLEIDWEDGGALEPRLVEDPELIRGRVINESDRPVIVQIYRSNRSATWMDVVVGPGTTVEAEARGPVRRTSDLSRFSLVESR